MNTQIATSLEQSQRLIACGVNPDSADMLLYNNALSVQVRGLGKIPECATPAWSLSALLELLPQIIDKCWLTIQKLKNRNNQTRYGVAYMVCKYDKDGTLNTHSAGRKFSTITTDLMEACIETIEWLTANGYTLNTK
ncbi:MAG: hypothetical protein HDS59_00190 [Barnesiella sp.]|nr:hypothetical protein [Barnesiella sp.]